MYILYCIIDHLGNNDVSPALEPKNRYPLNCQEHIYHSIIKEHAIDNKWQQENWQKFEANDRIEQQYNATNNESSLISRQDS